MFFYLYMIMDVYSRKIVGYEVHLNESADHAAELIRKATLAEKTHLQILVLHADNGSPMKGSTMLVMLDRLGVRASFSRPRVSNDNAYAESLFKTCKYRSDYPENGFASLEHARQWVMEFVQWYNHVHKHSGLKFVTPAQRHNGEDIEIREARKQVYLLAREKNPQRWSADIRNWDIPNTVTLNPEKVA